MIAKQEEEANADVTVTCASCGSTVKGGESVTVGVSESGDPLHLCKKCDEEYYYNYYITVAFFSSHLLPSHSYPSIASTYLPTQYTTL